MTDLTLKLGYQVGNSTEVRIPIRHMVVTGQTQRAGKTTALEALARRALDDHGVTTIAFLTKRGEGAFGSAYRLAPIFRERADWQFVASVLEASMREKFKFERAWIVRASKGAKTLAQVQTNVRALMAKHTSGLNHDVYMMLDTYLEIVVPRLAQVRFGTNLHGVKGPNVMDLSDAARFPPELQGLVMRSALEAVYQDHTDVITVIPEAWKFLPQGRGSPVKLAAVELIRKGAALRNYVWLDSQDIGGVDKEVLRSCTVWLLGVQREANEIKRVLENIPAGLRKPRAQDIASLKRGEFFACFDDQVVRTYAQPAEDEDMGKEAEAKLDRIESAVKSMLDGVAHLANLVEKQMRLADERPQRSGPAGGPDVAAALTVTRDRSKDKGLASLADTGHIVMLDGTDEDALYQRFRDRLAKEAPTLLKVLVELPEIQIEVKRVTVQTDLTSAKGMIAKLIAEGFFDSAVTAGVVWKETKRRWNYGGISARAYEQCETLASIGFLTKEADGYRAVPSMKVNIQEVAA